MSSPSLASSRTAVFSLSFFTPRCAPTDQMVNEKTARWFTCLLKQLSFAVMQCTENIHKNRSKFTYEGQHRSSNSDIILAWFLLLVLVNGAFIEQHRCMDGVNGTSSIMQHGGSSGLITLNLIYLSVVKSSAKH